MRAYILIPLPVPSSCFLCEIRSISSCWRCLRHSFPDFRLSLRSHELQCTLLLSRCRAWCFITASEVTNMGLQASTSCRWLLASRSVSRPTPQQAQTTIRLGKRQRLKHSMTASQFHHGGPVVWCVSLVTLKADTIPRGVIWLAKSDATNIQSHSSI